MRLSQSQRIAADYRLAAAEVQASQQATEALPAITGQQRDIRSVAVTRDVSGV
jgi:hypothetical protein